MKIPKVSVITRTYNRAEVLPRAIRCMQSQTMQDYEHIIVDDCSTDQTRKIIENYAKHDPRVSLYYRAANSRRFLPRQEPMNTGLAFARGNYFAYLDDDFLWRDDCLEVLSNYLDQHPNTHLVYGDTCDHSTEKVIASFEYTDERPYSFKNKTSIIYPHRGDFTKIEFFASGRGYKDYIDTNEFMHTRYALEEVGGIWNPGHIQRDKIIRVQGERFAYRTNEDIDFVERIIAALGVEATAYIPKVIADRLDAVHADYWNPCVYVTNEHIVCRMNDMPQVANN